MALQPMAFSPPTGWLDSAEYPTQIYNNDGVVRQKLQKNHDQLRDYINDTLKPAIEANTADIETNASNIASLSSTVTSNTNSINTINARRLRNLMGVKF